jgi:RNA polymerase sigma-70 factor, ECF subfamily
LKDIRKEPMRMKWAENSNDVDLIAAILAGDTNAFAIIVRRYEGPVAGTVVGMLGPGDEAEEVGQITMVNLYRSLDQFQGDAELKTYITRIAINASLDALRKRKRYFLRFWTPTNTREIDLEEPAAQAPDPAETFETKQAVHAALSHLSPEFRTVAILRLMQGYSVDEVADILKIAPGTVMSRLARAKSKLSTLLRETS